MGFVVALALAFVPGIVWMVLIYRWDNHREPRWLVIRTLLWGVALAVPVVFAELLLAHFGSGIERVLQAGSLSLSDAAYQAFIVAGFTEELGKFMVVRLAVYRQPYFDEPMDGVVYSAAVALGFASLENLGYVVRFGLDTILLRGPISTLGHVMFSMLWGYPLALRKIRGPKYTGLVWLGLFGAMAAHGLYDFLLFSKSWYSFLVIPGFVGLIVLFVVIIRHARRISPFRPRTELLVACPECALPMPSYAGVCPVCGKPLSASHEHAVFTCGKCGAGLPTRAAYCASCGSRLVDYPLSRTSEPRTREVPPP